MDCLEDNISVYLPQYLSSESKRELLSQLVAFSVDDTKSSIYSNAFKKKGFLLQGDGIGGVPYIFFPDTSKNKEVDAILISNTCDMSLENNRLYPSKVMYVPLLRYDKYAEMVKSEAPMQAENHLKDVKKQYVTQMLFLPQGSGLTYDAIAFFDQAISLPLSKDLVDNFCCKRLFSLSNFGFYLLLLKISIHFTRIKEKLDRNEGIDLSNCK